MGKGARSRRLWPWPLGSPWPAASNSLQSTHRSLRGCGHPGPQLPGGKREDRQGTEDTGRTLLLPQEGLWGGTLSFSLDWHQGAPKPRTTAGFSLLPVSPVVPELPREERQQRPRSSAGTEGFPSSER